MKPLIPRQAHGRHRHPMAGAPYLRFGEAELILRDELAIDRTLLANERTLLAYLRSGVALLLTGATIMHFATTGWFWLVGLLCLPLGLATGVFGVARHRRVSRAVGEIRDRWEAHAKAAAAEGPPPAEREGAD